MLMDESDMPQMQARITSRLIDSLYTEAMLLADEARSYFDEAGREERSTLEPFARVGFACESLKVTTRIMHIVPVVLATLPPSAQRLIGASSDLYARVRRLDEGGLENDAPQSPARALMGRLERGLGGQSG